MAHLTNTQTNQIAPAFRKGVEAGRISPPYGREKDGSRPPSKL